MIDTKYIDILNHCANNNTEEFNRNKAVEEATEFNEVVLKYVTKNPLNEKRPDKEEFIKEFGDFVYRGFIFLKQQFPELSNTNLIYKIKERIETKLDNLIDYNEKGKYEGGL